LPLADGRVLVLLASRCWLRARSAMPSEVPRRGRMRNLCRYW